MKWTFNYLLFTENNTNNNNNQKTVPNVVYTIKKQPNMHRITVIWMNYDRNVQWQATSATILTQAQKFNETHILTTTTQKKWKQIEFYDM